MYDRKEYEIERGKIISEDALRTRNQISNVESLIAQIQEKISETDALIQKEQKTQEEIENLIAALAQRKLKLQEQIHPYEEIAEGDPRVLITMEDPEVKAKVKEVTRRWDASVQEAIFEYVRDEIKYTTEGNPKKWSYPKPFLKFKFDFWQLPRETIQWKKGDCEDKSILLCTMMRIAGVPASDVRVVLGLIYLGDEVLGGHAWCEFKLGTKWYVLEATCSTCGYIERSEYYDFYSPEVWGWFNDEEYHEEKPGDTGGFLFTIL